MDSHFLKIAYVSKSHGIRGEIFIRPFNPQASWPLAISSLKIAEQIFCIEHYSAHKQGFIVKLKNCDTKKSADQFKSQPVFLDKKYFESKKGELIYLAELLNFNVEILKHDKKGQLIEFQSDKHQDFLVISFFSNFKKNPNKDFVILVPFVSAYIQKIDFKNKKLILDLPENFLSVFKQTSKKL